MIFSSKQYEPAFSFICLGKQNPSVTSPQHSSKLLQKDRVCDPASMVTSRLPCCTARQHSPQRLAPLHRACAISPQCIPGQVDRGFVDGRTMPVKGVRDRPGTAAATHPPPLPGSPVPPGGPVLRLGRGFEEPPQLPERRPGGERGALRVSGEGVTPVHYGPVSLLRLRQRLHQLLQPADAPVRRGPSFAPSAGRASPSPRSCG
ncbi:uncharacterized protein [Narcine bancroftii]|uniref:uncharacterized protein n=1 Tax=Narcine bancroftii TaxID=1343680 RepID=UPI00383231EC